MIRGHPLRKTGSAASHGGLSTELFYYKSGRLATGKKQMWRVSQKIHRGSLAFFGKWDKINRIRGMPRPKKCAAERNPPVTASPCQPPLGKGALGRGVRIATTSDRSRRNSRVIPRPVRRLVVGSEPSAASGRGSEVSEWPRSKFPASAVRQRRNFGYRNRVIRNTPAQIQRGRGLPQPVCALASQ